MQNDYGKVSLLSGTASFLLEKICTYSSSCYRFLTMLSTMGNLEKYFALGILPVYILWKSKKCLAATELVCANQCKMKEIIETFNSYKTGYQPTLCCLPSLSMTIIPSKTQRRIKVNYQREILPTPTGRIEIDWENCQNAKNKLIVMVLPGMNGSSSANYITHFVHEAIKLNCICVVVNIGVEVDLFSQRYYSGSNYDDLENVIRHVKSKYPEHSLFAVGISYGGLKLAGYLSKNSENPHVSNAMIVSVPFNTSVTIEEIQKPQNLLINKAVTRKLIQIAERGKHLFANDKRFDLHKIKSEIKSFSEFMDYFISRQYGYQSSNHYHEDCSISVKIQNIRVPTIFLNSIDDLFSPGRAFPLDKFMINPNIALIRTSRGGHISFSEGILPVGCSFACRLFNDYLQSVLNGHFN